MSGAATSKESAAFCADVVRMHDFARYASTLFLPQVQRRALLSVYAFNVEISRVREQVSQPLPGEMRLQWWTDMLEGAGHGGVEGNPVAAELLQTIGEFRLPVEPLMLLVVAVAASRGSSDVTRRSPAPLATTAGAASAM